MSKQTRKELIFNAADMSGALAWEYKLNANFGFFLHFWVTGLSGSSALRVYASTQVGGPWALKILRDKKGKLIEEVPITTDDNNAIEANNFRADFIRVEVDAATAGTITAFIDIQENNNTY